MEYRRLGSSGLRVSTFSFGSWVTFGTQIDEQGALACMAAAHERGVNFFDNAEVYAAGEAERIMGRAIRRLGWKRSDLVLSTKLFWGGQGPNDQGLSRKHILEGTDASLERMQLDYVDLLFCHRPDLHTPMEETVRAMDHVVRQGKALYWGTSEWSAEQIRHAHAVARGEHLIPPTMEQPQYNMFQRERVERELAPLYADLGLGTTIWSPLAAGILTGKYAQGVPAGSRMSLPDFAWLKERLESEEGRARQKKVRALAPLAADLGCSLAQLALAWCVREPHVSTAITGATRPEQVAENLAALAVLPKLTPEVLERIEAILANRPKPETDFRNS